MLADFDIVDRLQTAFLPLHCHAELWGAGAKLRLRIYSDDEVVLGLPELRSRNFRQEADFNLIVDHIRDCVMEKGFSLADQTPTPAVSHPAPALPPMVETAWRPAHRYAA